MVKGHYTDWVENPEEYPITGMGGANVGPEFSAEEYHALVELEKLEQKIIHRTPLEPSHFIETLQHAVFASNRWKKWLLPDEIRTDFWNLPAGRREWLIKTGSRYIWTDESVNAARNQLYQCLSNHGLDPHAFVIEKISNRVEKYIDAFNLQNSIDILY
jgi:tagatose-1,6-bisphosphate aldolase non-catalytic subunit AgaZ/GatZ